MPPKFSKTLSFNNPLTTSIKINTHNPKWIWFSQSWEDKTPSNTLRKWIYGEGNDFLTCCRSYIIPYFLSLKSLLIKSYPVGLHLLSLAMSCFVQDVEKRQWRVGIGEADDGPKATLNRLMLKGCGRTYGKTAGASLVLTAAPDSMLLRTRHNATRSPVLFCICSQDSLAHWKISNKC